MSYIPVVAVFDGTYHIPLNKTVTFKKILVATTTMKHQALLVLHKSLTPYIILGVQTQFA
jgi:hypothetical protein